MLPELDKKQFTSSIDARYYYQKKISKFISINKSTNESVSKYNAKMISEINDMFLQYLNPVIYKFAIIGNLARHTDNITAFRAHLTVIQSLNKQKKFIIVLKNTLKKAKINAEWYNIIYKIEINEIIKRCKRLEKDILPELIESSDLYIYLKYLDSIGVDFSDDIQKVTRLDFDSDEFKDYCSNIVKVCNSYFNTLSKDEQKEIINISKRHRDATEFRRNLAEKQKSEEKEKKLQLVKDDINENLPIYVSSLIDSYFRKNSSNDNHTRKFYNNVDKTVERVGRANVLNGLMVVLAYHYIGTKEFYKSHIRYVASKYKSGFTKDCYSADIFVIPYENDKINEIKENLKNKYVVCEVSLSSAYDYVKNNSMFESSAYCGLENCMTLDDYISSTDKKDICTRYNSVNIEPISLIDMYYKCSRAYNIIENEINCLYSLIILINKLGYPFAINDYRFINESHNYKTFLTQNYNKLRSELTYLHKNNTLNCMLEFLKDCDIYNKSKLLVLPDVNDLISSNRLIYMYYINICSRNDKLFLSRIKFDYTSDKGIRLKCNEIVRSLEISNN